MYYLMALGQFKFEIGINAYSSLSKKTSYRWEELKTFGSSSMLHYTGRDSETLSLSGLIYGYHSGERGIKAYERLKLEAAKGIPFSLVDNEGNNHGRWVIVSLSKDESLIDRYNTPKKISFNIELKEYGP
ncbi:MAG: phage tail protein [Oligoflexales bacterium]